MNVRLYFTRSKGFLNTLDHTLMITEKETGNFQVFHCDYLPSVRRRNLRWYILLYITEQTSQYISLFIFFY